jgi:hypothetical protein
MSKIGERAAHYLAQKPWTPWNVQNVKKKYEVEERAKEYESREKERAAMIRKQGDLEEQSKMISAIGGDLSAVRTTASHPLNFMYSAPPGVLQDEKIKSSSIIGSDKLSGNLAEVIDGKKSSSGGDEVEKFKSMWKSSNDFSRRTLDHSSHQTPSGLNLFNEQVNPSSTTPIEIDQNRNQLKRNVSPPRPQTALEKLAGVKARSGMSVAEQMERFEVLKNAPVESYAKSMKNISFQPLGKVIRNVQCLRCKQWGHEVGDRECPNREMLPSERAKHLSEDPMAGYSSQERKHFATQPSSLTPFEAREDDKGWGGIQFPDFNDPRKRKRSRSEASSSSSRSRRSSLSASSSTSRKNDRHSRKHKKHKKHHHRKHKKHHDRKRSSSIIRTEDNN